MGAGAPARVDVARARGDRAVAPALSVYVDEPLWEWRGRRWCHLVADAPEELHALAADLGLRRAWFQSRPGRPWKDHYDLPQEERERAIALGAVPLSFRETGALLARKRAAEREPRGADGG
ncbi:MAG: DUF4031 domain-containing protein [Actinomycetota bacterium]|nr:DUF4031 domain-containing protein [Actinomycetota bacterium]